MLCFLSPKRLCSKHEYISGKTHGESGSGFRQTSHPDPFENSFDLLFQIFHGCIYFINLHHLSGIILNAFVMFILLGNLVNDVRGRLKSCWKAVFNLANAEPPTP